MVTMSRKRRRAREALRVCIEKHTGRQISGTDWRQKPGTDWSMELYKWEAILECVEPKLHQFGVSVNHADAVKTLNVTLTSSSVHVAVKMTS